MEVTATLILDLAQLAKIIESLAGEVLLPEEPGFYLPFELEPRLRFDQAYFVLKGSNMTRIDDLTNHMQHRLPLHDILNRRGEVVVDSHQLSTIRDLSWPFPSRTAKLIRACVDHIVLRHGCWTGSKPNYHRRTDNYNLIAVIREFVQPQYSNYEQNVELLSTLEGYLSELRASVLEFLGKDKWIMHFVKTSRGTMTIEKTIDYRIYSWMTERGLTEHSQENPHDFLGSTK